MRLWGGVGKGGGGCCVACRIAVIVGQAASLAALKRSRARASWLGIPSPPSFVGIPIRAVSSREGLGGATPII